MRPETILGRACVHAQRCTLRCAGSPGMTQLRTILPFQGVMLAALLTVGGCAPHRPSFVLRIGEDCGAGDRWACDLLDSLGHPELRVGSPHAHDNTAAPAATMRRM